MSDTRYLEPVINKWALDVFRLASGSLDLPEDLEAELNGGGGHEVGAYYANLLDQLFSLGDRKRILEIGCGYGRIAMHVAPHLGVDQSYVGLDPHARSVEWATKHIGAKRSNMDFVEIDVRSGTYNPHGVQDGKDYVLPIESGTIDLVYMTSVFTHLDLDTTRNYLREISRVLVPHGAFFSTHFLVDDAARDTFGTDQAFTRIEIPYGDSYVASLARPEDAIAHPADAILDCYDANGLAIETVDFGFWRDKTRRLRASYQDHIIAYKRGRSARPTTAREARSQAEQDFATRFESAMSVALNVVYWCIQGCDVVFPTPQASHSAEQLKELLGVEPAPTTAPIAYHALSAEISARYLTRSKVAASLEGLQTAITHCWDIAEAFRLSGARSIVVTEQAKTVEVEMPLSPV